MTKLTILQLQIKSVTRTLKIASIAAVIFAAHISWATSTREDATLALWHLRHSAFAEKTPDDMKSVETTFSLAERYYYVNEREMAERYYLLTIQKIRVLETTMASPQPATSPDNQQPENTPGPSVQPSKPEAPSQQHPGETGQTGQTFTQGPVKATHTIPAAPAEPSQSAPTPDSASLPDDFVSKKLVGSASTYTVINGDTLRLIAAKLGVSQQQLLKMNNLTARTPLKIGQKLKFNNRKIIPQRLNEGIIVNIPDRTLYYFRRGRLVTSLPVALGSGKKSDKFDWQTPTGKFRVTAKQKDPTWHVPPSIRSEMEDSGKEIMTSIPPGPDNPLGRYAIMTSIPGILIHSTIKPWSIYSFASHGCIRVSPLHMDEFFKEVRVNTPGEIIYKPVKLAVTEQGRIFLEVHQDIYGKTLKLDTEARNLIHKYQLSERVDWKKMEAVVKQKSGIAEDISL